MIHWKLTIHYIIHDYRPGEVTKNYTDNTILFFCENNFIPLQEFMKYVRLCEYSQKTVSVLQTYFFIVVEHILMKNVQNFTYYAIEKRTQVI